MPEAPRAAGAPGPAIGRRGALAALAALTLAACARRAPAAAGGARVVSLSPSTTEAVCAIGVGAALVGRSRHCDHPPEVLRLPSVGGYADPSIEAIVALSPTLVTGARGPAGPALEEALRGHGIETFFPETESLAQIEGMLADLGRRLGAAPGAEQVIARLRARRRAVERAVQGKPRVRVALLFDTAPIFVAGPGSFADELLRLAGGENVITRGGAYPSISVENLLALDPDVLLDGTASEGGADGAARLAALREAPGWRSLRAVQEGHLRPLRTDVVLRPGPRIGEGLAAVARALHGDTLALSDAAEGPRGEPRPEPLLHGGGAGLVPPSRPGAP
ncbi:periplasmic substrate-binding protein [Sorangium cellulosum]|uniref:Periplasmic substrate-binding protein n=1 Tax=Sorangium cellulosum TaxID=56 RepID=A0A2L0F956_SORCE|nr:helical backbone metal receptor [Sorangium cellulosum]AUX48116.1 periplasmic substrate-binding protein [Sorangium cellulosum]